jgi:hypothetical protein
LLTSSIKESGAGDKKQLKQEAISLSQERKVKGRERLLPGAGLWSPVADCNTREAVCATLYNLLKK